jgi:PilZ domain
MQERKFIRYSTGIPISFEIEGMMGKHHHYLKDASQGGLCFSALGCIKTGTHVDISAPINGEYCHANGKVAWCQPLDNAQCLLGISFDETIEQPVIDKVDFIN